MSNTTELESPPSSTDGKGLHRALQARHISMIALGGIIGAGLFVGSGAVIHSAGALATVAYAFGGVVLVLIMRMLAEMAAARPTTGSFAEYARQALGQWAGFSVGWTYWYFWVVVVAFEAIAGAEIIHQVLPQAPLWAISAGIMLVMTVMNLLSVRIYGEAEFWFASIKIVAIVVFLGLGILGLFDLLPSQTTQGIAITADTIAPSGLSGFLNAVVVVIFSYFGAEIITVAAAEAKDPVRAVTRASATVVWRVIIFYVGSTALIILLVPWNEISADSSPFITLLEKLGIPGAAGIMQAVVLTAVLSVLNSGIYTSSRMLFNLTQQGEAPRFMAKTSLKGVPVRATLVATLAGWISVGIAYLAPGEVFTFLLNAAGSVALAIYFIVALSQLRLRRSLDQQGETSPVRMWAYPYLTWMTLLLLSGTVVTMLILPGVRTQLLIGVTAPAVFVAVFFLRRLFTGLKSSRGPRITTG